MPVKMDINRTAIFILAALLFAFVAYKATTCSITHDEAKTFSIHAQRSWIDIVQYKEVSANNHLLNTLLVKASTSIFGNSELAIRLPNIAAYLCYLVFCGLLVLGMDRRLSIPSFLILQMNPYLLDFFSLARGYGLAVAMMMGAICFLKLFVENASRKYGRIAIAFAFLMVLSNFSCVYLFLIFLAVIVLKDLKERTIPDPVCLVIAAILGAIIYGPIKKLIDHNELYFGGDKGFWSDTVQSLIREGYYQEHISPGAASAVSVFVVLVFIAVAILFFLAFKAKSKDMLHADMLLWIVTAAIPILALTMTVNHSVSGTKFLIERTALFLFALFLLVIVLVLQAFAKRQKNIALSAAWTLSVLMVVHTCVKGNTTSFLDWKYDSNTKQAMTDLAADAEQNKLTQGEKKIKLDISWVFEPSTNYYRTTRHYDWLMETERSDDITDTSTYIYVLAKNSIAKKKRHTVLKAYPSANSILIRQER